MITISPQELQAVLTLASKAPTTLGESYGLAKTLDELVALANQSFPIGAIVPTVVPPPDVGSSSSDFDAVGV